MFLFFDVFYRSWKEAEAETPEENDVAAGRRDVRETDADGPAGHADDRRQGAQGAAAGRRVADHIQADAAEEI